MPEAELAPVYEARELKKEFDGGKVPALRGVNFVIGEGEFVAIVGTSGSGKSTLLNMLGTLDEPTSGELLYRGDNLAKMSDPAAYRAKEIGFIFQSFHLLPAFTVEENVQFPMFGQGLSTGKRRERARELLDLVGLSHRLGHLPTKLSGGERQRAAIARSLANEPAVLLADEPTGNLDSKNAEQITDLMGKLHREKGTTMVMVTHDMEVAAKAGRTISMKDGVIIGS